MDHEESLKLNLGCGENPISGYVNVDKYGDPDLRHDLELFPRPWEQNSVQEIVMNHKHGPFGTAEIRFR